MIHRTVSAWGKVAALAATWAIGAAATAARGDVLALYEFQAGGESTDAGAHSAAGPVGKSSGFPRLAPSVGNLPPSLEAFAIFDTLGEAKTAGVYHSSTLTPSPGYAISLQSFRTDVSALAEAVAPFVAQVSVYTSVDGFLNPIYFNFATDPTARDLAISPWAVFENGALADNPLYQNVTAPIEFRYYVWGNDRTLMYLDNIRITGTTTPVPEPAGAAAAFAGLAAALAAGRARTASRGRAAHGKTKAE